jgi:hypothetical protein
MLCNARVREQERKPVAKEMFTNRDDSLAKQPAKRKSAKIGRNDPCPCGSGKKFKMCHGATEEGIKEMEKLSAQGDPRAAGASAKPSNPSKANKVV